MRRDALAATAALAIALALAAPPSAFAHVPVLEQPGRGDTRGTTAVPFPQAQQIKSPVVSTAIYGYLAKGEELDAYAFTVPVRVTTTIGLLVPVRAGLGDFRPTLALFSEGKGERKVLRDPGAAKRARFYEAFSLASFYNGGSGTVTLVPGERYYLVVTGGQGKRTFGAYTIAVSGPEQFSAGDSASAATVLPRIWLGSWGGGPVRPGAIACLTLLPLLAVIGVVWWVRRRIRKRAEKAEVEAEPPAEPTATG